MPNDPAPEGPAGELQPGAPAWAAHALNLSAMWLTGGRCSWAPAADPRGAVSCAGPPGSSRGLRPLLPFQAVAPRGKLGRGGSGPREASARPCGWTAGPGERDGAPGDPTRPSLKGRLTWNWKSGCGPTPVRAAPGALIYAPEEHR
ncbi:hypothetical protein NDU88_010562 [Pleurodeles waltl]|uniref:Uncharacterized protein n=1 Tax=Pleurodeles waltl TaxID=8319 RepID=A0AAV7QUQ1_PLEWA|nr:hypothetical protein NDU88_010562 [Pleurodeles waltl]